MSYYSTPTYVGGTGPTVYFGDGSSYQNYQYYEPGTAPGFYAGLGYETNVYTGELVPLGLGNYAPSNYTQSVFDDSSNYAYASAILGTVSSYNSAVESIVEDYADAVTDIVSSYYSTPISATSSSTVAPPCNNRIGQRIILCQCPRLEP